MRKGAHILELVPHFNAIIIAELTFLSIHIRICLINGPKA